MITPKLPRQNKIINKRVLASDLDESDSDSSLDNYLIDPDKLNLADSFFDKKSGSSKTKPQSRKFSNCSLSLCYVYCEIVAVLTKLSSTPKPESNGANFAHLIDHLQKVEDLKKKVSEEVERATSKPTAPYSLADDIRETLFKMEGIPGPSQQKKKKTRRNSEDDSDWEEVQSKLGHNTECRETNRKVERFVCKKSVIFNYSQNQDHLLRTVLTNDQEHEFLDSYPIRFPPPS